MHFQNVANRELSADIDAMYTMIEKFKAENPNVTIEETMMDQADYHVKMQAQAAAGDLPDVFFLKGSWTTMFVDNEAVAPINEYLDALPFKDQYRSGIFDAVNRDGQFYGSPFQFAITSVVYYNADLWKKAGYDSFPTTWDEVFAANEKFKEMGVYTIALGNRDKWPYESCILSALGDRFTGTEWTNSIIAQDGAAKFTDQPFVDALALSQKLATSGVFNPDFNTITNEQAQSYFLDGKAATCIEGYWALSRLESLGTPEFLANMKLTLLPGVDGGKGSAGSTSGGCGWYLAVNSQLEGAKKDAAMALVFAITGQEFSNYLAENYGLAGACVTGDVDVTKFPETTQDYLKLMTTAQFTPIYDILMEGSVIETMNAGLQDLLNNTVTPEALAEAIQAEQDSL